MKTKLVVASAIINMAILSSSAFANASFDGVYAGAVLGAYSSDIENIADGGISRSYTSNTNYAAGVQLGYGKAVYKSLYLGFDLSLSSGGVKSSSSLSDTTGVLARYTSEAKSSRFANLKVGYVVNDNFMLYGKYGRGVTDYESTVTFCQGVCSGGTVNRDMQTVGLGLVYKVTNDVLTAFDVARSSPTQTTEGQRVEENILSASVMYKF